MILIETVEIARLLKQAGVRYWIFGGNGVELALGRDLRPHEDVDVFVALADAPAAVRVLESSGFEHHVGSLEAGDVFYRRGPLLVDVVPIDDGADPPRTVGKLAALELPSGLLEPNRVRHAGFDVVTLTPEMHLAMKGSVSRFYGVPPREKDRLDIEHLNAWCTAMNAEQIRFTSTLFRVEGKGGWTFATVPEELGPSRTEGWGRAPVVATVDGRTWKTSVWRERSGRTLLPVPKAIRGGKGHGDSVEVRLKYGR